MREKPRFLSFRKALISICVLVAVVLLLATFSGAVSEATKDRARVATQDAIYRALVSCYAAEGSYPASLTHLEENYGVVINRQDYVVDYQIFASNVMPEVTLLERRANG